MDESVYALTENDPTNAVTGDASTASTETNDRERTRAGCGPGFLLSCASLGFLVLLAAILVSQQASGDSNTEDDGNGEVTIGNQAYGKFGGSGGPSKGGATKSSPLQPTQNAAVTSAPVQPPATRGPPVPQMTPLKSPTAPPARQTPSAYPSPIQPTSKTTPVPPPQPPVTTKSTRLPPSTPRATGTPPTKRPTTPSTPMQSTSTTLKPLVERPPTITSVICTVDSEGVMEVPPDGLCDFIFYDSLTDPFEKLGKPSHGKFKTFQSLAAKGNQTQFGVSIFALDIVQFSAHMNRPTAIAWATEKLWNHNIYHWGVMNMHKTILSAITFFVKALSSLKKAAEISKPSPTKRVASYTFLGFYVEKDVACDETSQYIKSVYTPNVLVFLGHISFKEQDVQTEVENFVCLILPPSIYKIPPSVKNKLVYGHTFGDAASMVTCMSERGINPVPVYAVSVTLKGRWYVPKVDDVDEPAIGAYGVFEECDSFLEYAVPQLICGHKKTKYLSNLAKNQTDLYMRTYDKSPGRKQTFVYDDAQTQGEKICHARYNDTTYAFTIAPYDVNYDYAQSECQQRIPGLYNRTESYKKLIEFLNSYASKQHKDCLGVVYG